MACTQPHGGSATPIRGLSGKDKAHLRIVVMPGFDQVRPGIDDDP
jgi:hypothetical protein